MYSDRPGKKKEQSKGRQLLPPCVEVSRHSSPPLPLVHQLGQSGGAIQSQVKQPLWGKSLHKGVQEGRHLRGQIQVVSFHSGPTEVLQMKGLQALGGEQSLVAVMDHSVEVDINVGKPPKSCAGMAIPHKLNPRPRQPKPKETLQPTHSHRNDTVTESKNI